MMRRTLASVSLAATLGWTSPLFGLGMGNIDADSALNEQLSARIPLMSVGNTSLSNIKVSVASQAAFERAGLQRSAYLARLRFEVRRADSGQAYVAVSTADPVKEPFLNFLVRVRWPEGQLLREYTVLLDPPIYNDDPSQPPGRQPETRMAGQSGSSQGATDSGARSQGAPSRGSSVAERSARGATGGGEYGPVQSNDTLYAIANQVRPNGVTVNQAMLALLRANPEAFVENNINRLKRGSVLRVPERGEMNQLTASAATREVREQMARWREGQQVARAGSDDGGEAAAGEQPDAATAESASGSGEGGAQGRLEVVAPDDSAGGEAGTSVAGGESGDGDNVDKLQNRVAMLEETTASLESENEDLKQQLSRIKEELAQKEAALKLQADSSVARLSSDGGASGEAGGSQQAAGDSGTADDSSGTAEDAVAAGSEGEDGDAVSGADGESMAAAGDREADAESGDSAADRDGDDSSADDGVVIAQGDGGGDGAGADGGSEQGPGAGSAADAEQASAPTTSGDTASGESGTAAEGEDGTTTTAADSDGAGDQSTGPEPATSEPAGLVTRVVDMARSNLQLIGIGGASAALVALLGIVLARRRRSAGEGDEIRPETPAPASDEFRETLGGVGAFDDTDDAGGDTVMAPGEADPVARADQQRAAGELGQAQDTLDSALGNDPDNKHLRYKLLEVLAERGDRGGFEAEAQVLHTQLDSEDDPLWASTVRLGRDIAPEHPLFGAEEGGAGEEPAETFDLDLGADTAGPASSREPEGSDSDSDSDSDFDLSFDLDDDPDTSAPDSQQEVAAATPEPAGDDFDLDFDEARDTAGGPASTASDDAGDDEFDFDLGEDDATPTAGEEADAASRPVEPAASAGGQQASDETDDFGALDFELPDDLDLSDSDDGDSGEPVREVEAEAATAQAETAAEADGAQDGGFEFDADDADDDLESLDEVSTKLDLARAYLDMGDPAGAKGLLEEVVEEGDNSQKEQAEELLQRAG